MIVLLTVHIFPFTQDIRVARPPSDLVRTHSRQRRQCGPAAASPVWGPCPAAWRACSHWKAECKRWRQSPLRWGGPRGGTAPVCCSRMAARSPSTARSFGEDSLEEGTTKIIRDISPRSLEKNTCFVSLQKKKQQLCLAFYLIFEMMKL